MIFHLFFVGSAASPVEIKQGSRSVNAKIEHAINDMHRQNDYELQKTMNDWN